MNITRNMTPKQLVLAGVGVATFFALGTFAAAALASPTGNAGHSDPTPLVSSTQALPTFATEDPAAAPTQASTPAPAPGATGASDGQQPADPATPPADPATPPAGPAAQPAGPATQPAGPAIPTPSGKNPPNLTLCIPCLKNPIQPTKPAKPGGSGPIYVGGLGTITISPTPVTPPNPAGIPSGIPKVPGLGTNPPLVPQGQPAPMPTMNPNLVLHFTN